MIFDTLLIADLVIQILLWLQLLLPVSLAISEPSKMKISTFLHFVPEVYVYTMCFSVVCIKSEYCSSASHEPTHLSCALVPSPSICPLISPIPQMCEIVMLSGLIVSQPVKV